MASEAGNRAAGLNGAEYSVLACLIDRASKGKGACFPSQGFISKWTFRPKRTVERAIATLQERKLIRVIDRGLVSNAYIINWPPLFKAYNEMKACERSHAAERLTVRPAKSGGTSRDLMPKVAAHVPPEVAAKPMKGTYEVKEPMTLSGSSDDDPHILVDVKKVEEALQGEQEASQAELMAARERLEIIAAALSVIAECGDADDLAAAMHICAPSMSEECSLRFTDSVEPAA